MSGDLLAPPDYSPGKGYDIPALDPVENPPFLNYEIEKGVTVKQYLQELLKVSGIPKKYQKEASAYILPYLDPAKQPEYDQILVQASQPCIQNAIAGNFGALEDRLDYVRKQSSDKSAQDAFEKAVTGSLMLSLGQTFLAPIRLTAIGENLVYDKNDNPIGTRLSDIPRMYPCDRYLSAKYTPIHKQYYDRLIKQFYENAIKKSRRDKTELKKMVVKSLQTLAKTIDTSVRDAIPSLKNKNKKLSAVGAIVPPMLELRGTLAAAKEVNLNYPSVEEYVNAVDSFRERYAEALEEGKPFAQPPPSVPTLGSIGGRTRRVKRNRGRSTRRK